MRLLPSEGWEKVADRPDEGWCSPHALKKKDGSPNPLLAKRGEDNSYRTAPLFSSFGNNVRLAMIGWRFCQSDSSTFCPEWRSIFQAR